VDTYKVKASQFDHFTETYEKKPLSKRWNEFPPGDVQRDLYSAFLIMNIKESPKEIDVTRVSEIFANFLELHNKEIDRIKALDQKQLSSMGI